MEEQEKLLDEIDAFLEEIGGYIDYNGRVEAVAEKFGMTKDEAENYVWMWASEVPSDVRYEEMGSKSVMDSDGFYTDYTWYKDMLGNRHVFVFGDRDLYRPEDENFDWEIEGDDERAQEEAQEWFNSYNGFDEDEDDYNEDDMMDESLRSTMTWCNISHPLKEAADREIDRKGFKSLIKYGVRDDGGNYAVLNDGYLVRKFWADNDDEAKEIFRRGPSRMPELTQDDMNAGQWYESLGEAKEEDPKTQAFKKATAAVEKKKEEDKKQDTVQRKRDLVKFEKELKKEKEPKRRTFLQATINKYKKEVDESLNEDSLGTPAGVWTMRDYLDAIGEAETEEDLQRILRHFDGTPAYIKRTREDRKAFMTAWSQRAKKIRAKDESLKESKEPNEDKWYDGLTKGQKESAMKIALWHKIVAKETSWDKLSAEDKKLVKQAYQKVEKLIKKHITNESLKESEDEDWYSQVHAPKSEVIYWLQDHEQAYEDILNHFGVSSLDYIGLDQIEEWISEHDQLAQDFENYFGEKSK